MCRASIRARRRSAENYFWPWSRSISWELLPQQGAQPPVVHLYHAYNFRQARDDLVRHPLPMSRRRRRRLVRARASARATPIGRASASSAPYRGVTNGPVWTASFASSTYQFAVVSLFDDLRVGSEVDATVGGAAHVEARRLDRVRALILVEALIEEVERLSSPAPKQRPQPVQQTWRHDRSLTKTL